MQKFDGSDPRDEYYFLYNGEKFDPKEMQKWPDIKWRILNRFGFKVKEFENGKWHTQKNIYNRECMKEIKSLDSEWLDKNGRIKDE